MAELSGARRVAHWVVLCAVAESVGMTAAAAAARTATALTAGSTVGGARVATAWGAIVMGGLVEGTAVGLAQAAALRRTVAALDRRRWVVVTVAVAGLGWAAASAPSVLAGDDGRAGPPALVIAGGAAGLGLAMGAVLGAAQGWVLRGAVPRPWHWVGVSAAAWTPAMVVIFAGASWAPSTWPTGAVVLLGTVTGAVAGAVLGAVCGSLVPALLDAPGDRRRATSASARRPGAGSV